MNWDAQKMHNKKEKNMRVSDNGCKNGCENGRGPTIYEKKYSRDDIKYPNTNAPTPTCRSTGEKVTSEMVELAKFAEEVSELLYNKTTGIVTYEPCEAATDEPMKSPYYPEYFQILLNQHDRIREALYRIKSIAERIDL